MDIPLVTGEENTYYPSQKPVALYERIIEMPSKPDDVVLDSFCGSGTTLLATKQLDRNGIGIDESENACQIAQRRFKNVEENDLNGIDVPQAKGLEFIAKPSNNRWWADKMKGVFGRIARET